VRIRTCNRFDSSGLAHESIIRREDGRVAGVGGCDYASSRQEGGDGGARSAARILFAMWRDETEYQAKRVRVISGTAPAIVDRTAAVM
jgi:hypothetical protein